MERIVVVVGHASANVREFVARRRLDVELVENDDFGLGNGSSVLVGGRAAAGRFLVAMVDHVVDGEAVTRLLASRADFALAVDSKPRTPGRHGDRRPVAGAQQRGGISRTPPPNTASAARR